jgi:hypothetical protein
MNTGLKDTLISSLIAGAVLCLVFTAYGIIRAWVVDMLETQAAMDEIAAMSYFPRIRAYPEMVKRFAAIHNARILDMLDLGLEPDNGDHYYYLHVSQPGLTCASMLIKRNGDTIALLHHNENSVAQALVNKCCEYVHDTTTMGLMLMFATRVMNSDVAPRPTEIYASYKVPYGMDAAILSSKLIEAGARVTTATTEQVSVTWYSKDDMDNFNSTMLDIDFTFKEREG